MNTFLSTIKQVASIYESYRLLTLHGLKSRGFFRGAVNRAKATISTLLETATLPVPYRSTYTAAAH
ncbi:hypothetical protein [Okeania sp. KiyG1]|uniref:hypothetical protein n=1 Tax=Okeania sp. KiyG1 TaxID=2720165 RepID=UPI001920C42F|nr:hypothetical protein [Okeania sp. KiyG1]